MNRFPNIVEFSNAKYEVYKIYKYMNNTPMMDGYYGYMKLFDWDGCLMDNAELSVRYGREKEPNCMVNLKKHLMRMRLQIVVLMESKIIKTTELERSV